MDLALVIINIEKVTFNGITCSDIFCSFKTLRQKTVGSDNNVVS